MHLLFSFSEIPLWSWITAAVIIVLAVIAIVCIVLWANKSSAKSKKEQSAPAKSKQSESVETKPAAKPVEKKTEPEPAETKPAAKPAEKKSEPKPAAKPAQKPVVGKEEPSNTIPKADKVYHISKRKQDGKWQVKAAGGAKAIKLFDTQKEAIAYAKTLADNQDARVVVHKMDGSFKKDSY